MTYLMGETGFEPVKAYASRFTVCPLWPLGNPSNIENREFSYPGKQLSTKIRGNSGFLWIIDLNPPGGDFSTLR